MYFTRNKECEHRLIIDEKNYCELRGIFLQNVLYQCWSCSRCQKCINKDTKECDSCKDNFKWALVPLHSNFQAYKPVCPRGYSDCVSDPAYIKHHYPDWYEELYGNKTPEEAIYSEDGCWDSYQRDPEMNYYCYDDEDK